MKKKILSWALYDWANSACATTIMAAFVPAFLTDYWSIGVESTLTTARLGITNSATSMLVALMTPALGALADQRGYKKIFCFIFMLLGALAAFALAFVDQGSWLLALLIFGVCMIGFNGSLVFYDSLLPSISNRKNSDHVSSLGYSLGYLGGGVLFLLNIFMCLKPEFFHLSGPVQGVKASFISVAIWWLLFSIPLFTNIPEPEIEKTGLSLFRSMHKSVMGLSKTFRNISRDRNLLTFLIAFWLYIDGVYTVMTMAVDYGKAVNINNTDMMIALLLVQFLGFPFALLFSKFADRWGCKTPILISISIYAVAVIMATWMSQSWHFYALAIVIGMVQGGVQALSRSLFSRMIPYKNAGEYFGLFNLVGKFAAILGPLLVALSAYLSGNSRFGMLGLLILFAIGGGLLLKVNEATADRPL